MSLNIYAFLLFMLLPISTSGDPAVSVKGTRTRLSINQINAPFLPRHSQTPGQTRFVLRSEPDGKELLAKVYEGNWFCIAFNMNTKSYVVGGILERGAWLPLLSILYLREDRISFQASVFDRLGYLAMTVIASPGGRYIVFIGGQNTTGTLYVLDTERDIVRKLGPAPAPPPPNALARDTCKGEPFKWGTCWGDGYVEMDSGIVRFKSENVLEVGYGDDSPDGRAKIRRVRRFKLD